MKRRSVAVYSSIKKDTFAYFLFPFFVWNNKKVRLGRMQAVPRFQSVQCVRDPGIRMRFNWVSSKEMNYH